MGHRTLFLRAVGPRTRCLRGAALKWGWPKYSGRLVGRALNTAYVLAPSPNATTATSLATTPSNAPVLLPADGVQRNTLLGITPAQPLPVLPVAAFVHTRHHYALTATGPMRHTPPPVPNVQQARNVLVMRMAIWMGCIWSALEEEICQGFPFFSCVLKLFPLLFAKLRWVDGTQDPVSTCRRA